MALASQRHQRCVEHDGSLADHVTHSLRELTLPHDDKLAVDVYFQPEQLNADSTDRVEFMVTINHGSRYSRWRKWSPAVSYPASRWRCWSITARKVDTPALIFDKVDVGISGPTAAIVGKMLCQLPQVSGFGYHHFLSAKTPTV